MTREIINVTQEAGMALIEILEIEPICNFCGCKIIKDNFGSIYNDPNVVTCNNLLCLSELSDKCDCISY